MIDILIVALIVLSAYLGWKKGALWILASLFVLIGAILIATAFATPFGKMLGFGNTFLQPVTGFFVLFIIIYILGKFLRKFLTPKSGIFAGADKILGLVFAVIRTILVLGLLLGFLRIFDMPSPKVANASVTYPIILRSGTMFVSQLKPLVASLSNDVFETMPADSLR